MAAKHQAAVPLLLEPATSQHRRYATQCRPMAASRHFTKQLGYPVPESTARKYLNLYRKELKASRKRHADSLSTITELPLRKRGRPLLLEIMHFLLIMVEVLIQTIHGLNRCCS